MTAQLARRRIERLSLADDGIAWQIMQMEISARRVATILDELLDIAHLEAGRPPRLNLAPCPLIPIVEAAVCAHQASTNAGQIIDLVAAAKPVGTWDAARLARVIDNLIANAIKYSPAGGEITLHVDEEANEDGTPVAVLRVQDRGVGIPAAEIDRVFERFFRGSNVGSIGGMGIGLAGARAIAEQHGGSLTVESHEGEGTTFTLRLPLDAAKPADAQVNPGTQ
jgi:signal transduction histidine kinase